MKSASAILNFKWTDNIFVDREFLYVVLASSFITTTIHAQENDARGNDRVLEEIVVTATLREVHIQDLAMSVGVLTGQQLYDINAVDIGDWWRTIPSLNVRDAAFGGNSIIIRGLSDTDSFNATESITSFYMDDTAMNYVTGLFSSPGDAAVLDLARVEVLRGPQGTLIGANSMGGAIRMISNEPDITSQTQEFRLSTSDTALGGWNYGGGLTLNQPTGKRSAVRLAALYQNNDGFIDDIGLGRTDINSHKRIAGRLSWLWDVSDSFEVLTRVYAEDIDSGGYNYSDPIGKPWAGQPTDDDYQVVLYSPEPRDESLRQASVRLKWLTDWGEVYSATSWFDKDVTMNIDWSPELFAFFGIDSAAPFESNMTQRDISQEIRISSDNTGQINWLAGFYYLDQNASRLDTGNVPGIFDEILNSTENTTRKDTAVFGEVSWAFSDTLEGTVGARWYQIERTLDSDGFFGPDMFAMQVDGNTSDVVPKISLSWNVTDESMAYALISEGFRPGQFNNAFAVEICGARVLIDSDDLTNYEIGFKSRLNEDQLSINVTAFHIDWKDMQINALNPDCGFVVLENAGSATSDGVEFDMDWLVTDRLRLQGGLGYNKAELAEAFTDPDVDAPAGTRIPNVPEWTANLAGTWDFNWSDKIAGYIRADAQYVGSRTTLFDQSPDFAVLDEMAAYTLVNLRIGGRYLGWHTELYVANLSNEFVELSCCRMFLDPAVARPRTIGLRASWSSR